MITIKKEPLINVGILTDKKISFELYGDFKSTLSQNTFSGRFTVEFSDKKILLKKDDEVIDTVKEIVFVPNDPSSESFLIRDVVIGVKFHWERKEKQRFTGSLKIIVEGDEVTAINILPIEKYLVSVISSEMSAKSSLQALKAHAIVSRSWLLAQIEKSKSLKKKNEKTQTSFITDTEHIKWYGREDHKNFDVCADDHCQRYQGITKIYTDVAVQAIEQTKGIVLINDSEICDTRYSKSCGGVSESFENVWEPIKLEYLSSIIDYKFEPEGYNLDFTNESNAVKWIKGNPSAFCNTKDPKILSQVLLDYDQETTDFYRWKVEYTQEQISDLIKRKSGIDFGEIVDLEPVERGLSSRLVRLKIVGTKKTLIIGKELEIRRTLSESHLYSSAFTVEKQNIVDGIPQKFVLYGGGWGHGVGLCQIGAAVMASKGSMFDEILLHYFTNATIKKIY
ncbi:MAG TPA: SpoIID/LytB domain-containing protein [Ignavibacteriaceae bacterium]|nr:SpoIID/LytB domain-containing protein [Ignavibacteriaceae bacterium]